MQAQARKSFIHSIKLLDKWEFYNFVVEKKFEVNASKDQRSFVHGQGVTTNINSFYIKL